MSDDTTILYCRCANSQIIPDDVKSRVLGALEESGLDFHIVSDLCGMAAEQTDELRNIAAGNKLKIAACYDRAVKWLFEWVGIDIGEIEVFNMRTTSPEEIIISLLGIDSKAPAQMALSNRPEWIPWFPIIDRDLCVNCKQCLDFCLFGVYTLVDGKVTVTNPKGCKTNCPACAKVCPKAAIIFPKYGQSPINGDKVDEDAVKAVNLKALMDGDLQEKLRQRSKRKRFAADSDTQDKKERLKNLQKELDIPQDVIDSLSPKDCPNSDFCDKDCQKENGVD
jgi:Pyruvate/2-oxoacid:ferredoxin oxidoreductase delta subunit